MNQQPYLIPAISESSSSVIAAEFEEEIKKSVFITQLAYAPSIDAAKLFIQQVKQNHSGARHHCWGFVVGRADDSMLWGFSDDGEPSGTAGKPILAQLSGFGVGELCAVVTRYSGGIKLGTGGLVKAYGGGVQQALKLVQTIEKKITTKLALALDYGLVSMAQSLMVQYDAISVSADYGQQVTLMIEIESRQVELFTQSLINKSSARIIVSPVDE